MQSIETLNALFALRDDGILEVERLPGDLTTADDVLDHVTAVYRLIGDKPRPALWKPRGAPFTDVGAWRQWIDVATNIGVAVAILHDERRDEPLPPFVEAADALLFPVKTFTDEAEAVEWLIGFVK